MPASVATLGAVDSAFSNAGDPVLHHLLVAGALAVEHQQVGAVRGSFGVAGFQLEHALERRASSGCAGCVGVHQPPAL